VSTRDAPLPAIAGLFPGTYYGWVVAAAAGVIMFATVGVGFYAMAVLIDGLPDAKGFTRAQVAGPTSLYFVLQGLLGPVVGRVVDRRGSRGVIICGAVALAFGLLLLGQVTEAWQLWPIYFVMATGFSLCAAIPTNALLARWFIGLRARALAYAHSGVSLGGIAVTPAATFVLHHYGLGAATSLLAGIAVGLAVPVAWFALAKDPRDHGLAPDGGAARLRDSAQLSEAYQREAWTTREALAVPAFWILALSFSLVLFAQQGLLIHEVALVHERTGTAQAGAFAVSLTALASVSGRLVVGTFADRFDKQRLALGVMAFQALTLVVFAQAEGLVSLYVSAVLFGLTIGNVFMLQSLLVGEFFGMTSFGRVFGALLFVTQVAGGFGPWGLAQLNEGLGGYAGSLRVAAVVAGLGAIAIAFAKPPKRPATPPSRPAV
jgi:MFS family permease